MTRQLFPDFGAEVRMTRNEKSFKVLLEEADCTIYLNAEKVQHIADKTAEDIALIAVLLAGIENVRQDTTNDKHKIKKLDEDTMAVAIGQLLKTYMIEELIFNFTNLKWHEIKKIMESSDPAKELEEIL